MAEGSLAGTSSASAPSDAGHVWQKTLEAHVSEIVDAAVASLGVTYGTNVDDMARLRLFVAGSRNHVVITRNYQAGSSELTNGPWANSARGMANALVKARSDVLGASATLPKFPKFAVKGARSQPAEASLFIPATAATATRVVSTMGPSAAAVFIALDANICDAVELKLRDGADTGATVIVLDTTRAAASEGAKPRDSDVYERTSLAGFDASTASGAPFFAKSVGLPRRGRGGLDIEADGGASEDPLAAKKHRRPEYGPADGLDHSDDPAGTEDGSVMFSRKRPAPVYHYIDIEIGGTVVATAEVPPLGAGKRTRVKLNVTARTFTAGIPGLGEPFPARHGERPPSSLHPYDDTDDHDYARAHRLPYVPRRSPTFMYDAGTGSYLRHNRAAPDIHVKYIDLGSSDNDGTAPRRHWVQRNANDVS